MCIFRRLIDLGFIHSRPFTCELTPNDIASTDKIIKGGEKSIDLVTFMNGIVVKLSEVRTQAKRTNGVTRVKSINIITSLNSWY